MAATYFYAGRFAKRNRKFKEARDNFEKALDLFDKCLGKHIMTAECIKNIADFYLSLYQDQLRIDEIENELGDVTYAFELNKSYECYEKALSIMKELGVDNHKEIVLTLKNLQFVN